MIYFYEITIHYNIGNRYIEKTYIKALNEIVDFLKQVDEKHKKNYRIFSIKPKRKNSGKIRIVYGSDEE
jgi:hypothetical protein